VLGKIFCKSGEFLLAKNIDQPIISRIEKGDRIVADYEIKAIAKALKVTVGWLLKEK